MDARASMAEQATAFMEDAEMAQFDLDKHVLVGPGGSLSVREDDEITRKLLMLMEGECEELGPLEAATKFGFSKQRYFQLRTAFNESGAGPTEPETRPEDEVPANCRDGPPGDPTSLPRWGRVRGGHRTETPANRRHH